jgi:cysteine-rich repeat protein
VCTGGDLYKPDTCYEICGDGKILDRNDRECDDGNVFDGDGCSSNCIVEPGFECYGGTNI